MSQQIRLEDHVYERIKANKRDEPLLAGDSQFGTIPGVRHEIYR